MQIQKNPYMQIQKKIPTCRCKKSLYADKKNPYMQIQKKIPVCRCKEKSLYADVRICRYKKKNPYMQAQKKNPCMQMQRKILTCRCKKIPICRCKKSLMEMQKNRSLYFVKFSLNCIPPNKIS